MKVLDEIRQRFEALETRERQFLAGGAIVLAVIVFFLAVIQPLVQYRERAAEDVAAERALVAWMRGAAEVLRERGPAASANVDTSGSLLALADSSARAAGLANALNRIQQEGDESVRVRLESANFDSLIRWLGELQARYGVSASEMTVDRAGAPGLVDASITLTRNAS